MPYYTPEAKTELGIWRVFDQLRALDLEGVQILKRLDNVRESLPLIKISCPRSRDYDETGDQITDDVVVSVSIRIETSVKEPVEHDRVCGVIRDWLRYEDFLKLLNDVMAGEQFQARQWQRGESECSTDGKRHVTEIKGELLMAPAVEGAP